MLRKHCGSCFRYVEDYKDAELKGYDTRYFGCLYNYSYYPRKWIKTICTCRGYGDASYFKECVACKYHKFRFVWNIQVWLTFRKSTLRKWYEQCEQRYRITRRNP